MRIFILFIVFIASCATASSPTSPSPDSLRDRLAEATRFYIGTDASSGSLDARRWTHDGWQDGDTALAIDGGELIASVDETGALTASTFDVELDPIEIPASVFGTPAELTGIRLQSTPTTAAIQWTTDDDASATLVIDLALGWSIAIDGASTQLGTQHLPPLALDIVLAGDGDHAIATLGLHAQGTIWGWAGLLELTKLDLMLSGATVD